MFTLKKLMTVAAAFLCQVAIAQPLAQRQMEGAKYFDGSAAAQAPAQAELTEGEWVSMGKGRWRDDFVTRIFNVECLEWDVEVLKNEAYPGVYRVKAPYLDYAYTSQQEIDPESYVDFHAEDPLRVYFTAYNTGLDLDGNGALCINSIAGYKVTELGVETGLVAAANEGACGEMQDGEILFPQASLLVKYEDSPNDQWMYANLNFGGYKTGFRLLLPDAPDLELNIDLVGANDAKDKMTVHFEVGKDCEKVRVAMLPGKANNDDWKALLEGTAPYQDITASQDVAFDYEADGVYTFYAIPYLNGTNRRVTWLTKELTYLNLGWRKLGQCQYTEAFLADMEQEVVSGVEPVTYAVDIEESTENPGYYRLIDPYGETYPYYTKNDYDNTRHYYMEVDATDPECVSIKEMTDGCGWNFGIGKMVPWSRADRGLRDQGLTKEDVKAQGLFGKVENNVITFPNDALLITFPDFYPFAYWANTTGKFRIVLPEGTGIQSVTADSTEAPAEIYDLNGRRVQPQTLTPGIYVKKQGGRAVKMMVK